MKFRFFFFTLLATLLPGTATDLHAGVVMAGNYKVEDVLVESNPAERTAADELRLYLHKIFGKLKVARYRIYVGYTEENKRFFGEELINSLDDEEFVIKSSPRGDIHLLGGRPRGTLYAAYWLLDRLLGVRWYTPDFEYVPSHESIDLGDIDLRQKPVFSYRPPSGRDLPYGVNMGRNNPQWSARNLLNDSGANPRRHHISQQYGGEFTWSPPYRCHALHLLIPPDKYFKQHPEWWALYKGERTTRGARGVSADYCLSSQGLVQETIKNIRQYLLDYPMSRLVSVQEGDATVAACECEQCQALLQSFGGKESGLWIYFTNQVGEALKEEFPEVKFITFAYTRSMAPPVNIEVAPNVGVQICAWGKSRGLPYADPRNKNGNEFISEVLQPWRKLTENIVFWDYIYSFGDEFLQDPNPLVSVENMKMFSTFTKIGGYMENSADSISNGQPFKTWLIARLQWNPEQVEGEELLEEFCRHYYGAEAGQFIADWWKLLRETNEKQGFSEFRAGGSLGKADFEDLPAVLQSQGLFQKALTLSASDAEQYLRVKDAYMPVQYRMLNQWPAWQAELQEKGIDIEKLYTTLRSHAELRDKQGMKLMDKFIKQIDSSYALRNIKAQASRLYGTYSPALAYDGNPETHYHAGSSAAWCQIEFDEPRLISRISSITTGSRNNYEHDYKVSGSLDGKAWFDLVPLKTVQPQEEDDEYFVVDDQLPAPQEVKFVRTTMNKVKMRDGRINDVVLREQYFNLEELPPKRKKK
ncbi:MAG: DUF4838 domain-containing protein [Lentisphaeria bacterium]|nr:DUF4838 domain-containing protein [Lentisphaeria bacterium]